MPVKISKFSIPQQLAISENVEIKKTKTKVMT